VKQRLLNHARLAKKDLNRILMKYALERVLYRISQSPHKEVFILKGALLFELWTKEIHRPTRDADFHSHGDSDLTRFDAMFQDICKLQVEDDGIAFDPASVKVERIKEDADYEGIRVTFLGYLENARLPVQIDIGFGDVITPQPIETSFPTLLDQPAPSLLVYPRETVIAEKFEALVKLGVANTRMKDFYDLRTLSKLFAFESRTLSEALRRTFERRGTPLPKKSAPTALTPAFYGDPLKQQQWNAFVTKNQSYIRPVTLPDVMADIEAFMMPILQADNPTALRWEPNGPWR
jgi:hypothetical protein